jgi:putative inorganic carbon (HCO3(-)) transporter
MPVGSTALRRFHYTSFQNVRAVVLAVWYVYLLVASTNGFGWIDSWHNEQRAVQLILLLATGLVVLAVYLRSGGSQLPTFAWPLSVVVGAGLVSSALAEFPFAAFGEVSLYTALAGLVFLTALAIRSSPRAPLWVGRAALFFAAAHCLGILVRYGAAISMQREITVDVLLLGFANPRFASALYVLLLPFLAGHALRRDERAALRIFSLSVLVMLWTFNLALGTRAVVFASTAGCVAFAWFFWRRRPMAIAWTMFATFAAGLVLYAVMFHLVPAWMSESGGLVVRQDPVLSPNGRQFLLRTSLDVMRAAPLLGIGPMQFAAIPHVWAAHPHNWVLQLATEYGVPAALCALLAVTVWLWRLRALVRSDEREGQDETLFAPALLMTLIALAYGLVDGNFVMPISQSAAAIGLGTLLGSIDSRKPTGRLSMANRYATAMAIAASALVVTVYGYVSFADQDASVKRFREIYVKDRFFVPRFWEQGLLIPPN